MSSQRLRQTARLRDRHVTSSLVHSFLWPIVAFVLAWNDRPGAPWFLTLALGLYGLGAITATCARVTARDFHGIDGIIGKKPEDDAR